MIRGKDIHDWLLWLMVFRIFLDLYSWKSLVLYLIMAIFSYVATDIIYERMEDKEC